MPDPVGIAGIVAALPVTSDLTRGHPPGDHVTSVDQYVGDPTAVTAFWA